MQARELRSTYHPSIHPSISLSLKQNSMASSINGPSSSFSRQKDLANKKHKDLSDEEKIFLLKQEIDNLRGQLNNKVHDPYGWKSLSSSSSSNYVPYKSSSSSSSSGSDSTTTATKFNATAFGSDSIHIPLLSLLLVATLMWVVTKVRRGSHSASWNPFSFLSSSSSFRRRPLPTTAAAAWEGSQFELQEQLSAPAPAALSSSSITTLSHNFREEDAPASVANNNNNHKRYEAPKAVAAAELHFV